MLYAFLATNNKMPVHATIQLQNLDLDKLNERSIFVYRQENVCICTSAPKEVLSRPCNYTCSSIPQLSLSSLYY